MGKQKIQPAGYTFPDVIVQFYKSITFMTSHSDSHDVVWRNSQTIDALFRIFAGFMTSNEKKLEALLYDMHIELDEKLTEVAKEQAFTTRKLALIGMFLYRVEAIPQIDYGDDDGQFYRDLIIRTGEANISDYGDESEMAGINVAVSYEGRIPYEAIVCNHFISIPKITIKGNIDMNYHIEILWSMLAPYVSVGRMDEWEKTSAQTQDNYNLAMNRLEVCSRVLMDSNFAWVFRAISYENLGYDDIMYNQDVNKHLNTPKAFDFSAGNEINENPTFKEFEDVDI